MSLFENQNIDKIKKDFEISLEKSLSFLGENALLKKACAYTLLGGGKRIRPLLLLLTGNNINSKKDLFMAAVSMECFHTASLIADDLPCMDDETERRNKEPVHKVFGEAAALLSSYALISLGYEMLLLQGKELKKGESQVFEKEMNERILLILENVTYNTGAKGATGGQYQDVYPDTLSFQFLKETMLKKTNTLFEMAMVAGFLFAGGKKESLEIVKKAAHSFGFAFQILDDFEDKEKDLGSGRTINIVNLLGEEKAREMFHEEKNSLLVSLEFLHINPLPFLSFLKEINVDII